MSDAPDAIVLPPSLRFLKWLVIVMTLTMIVGVITVVSVVVTRMPQAMQSGGPTLPENVVLPEGARPQAVTFGKTWFAVVTEDDLILIYGRDGALRQTIALK